MYLGKFYKQMALLQRSKTNDNQAKKTKEKKEVKMKMSTQIISQYTNIRQTTGTESQP